MRVHKINNVNKALDFIASKGVKLVSIGAEGEWGRPGDALLRGLPPRCGVFNGRVARPGRVSHGAGRRTPRSPERVVSPRPRLSQPRGGDAAGASASAVREVPGQRRSPRWSSEVKGASVSLSKVNAISGKLLRNT